MHKILFYTDAPYTGGATNQLLLLVKFIDKSEFEPIVVFDDYKSLQSFENEIKFLNIKNYKLEVKNTRDFRHYSGLKTVLKQEKPDLVHLHLSHSGSCRLAFLAARKCNIPVITTEHDPFPLSILKKILKKLTLKLTAHTIAISKNSQQILNEQYQIPNNKLSVIHNGIDIEKWIITNKENHSEFIIGLASELHERKGIDIFLKSLPKVFERYQQIRVLIAGNGEMKNELIKLIDQSDLKQKVTFLGKLKNIKSLLKTCDLFIVPSRRETFGLTAIEAMASGTPTILSNVGGLKELAFDHESALYFENGNSAELAEKIIELIYNPELKKKLQEEGLKNVQEHFSAERMADEYETIYKKVI